MKKQSVRYFKDDIYRTFAIYALIPITLVTLITVSIVYILWNRTINVQTSEKNQWMQQRLERVATSFLDKAKQLSENPLFYEELNDLGGKNKAYQELYNFTNTIPEDVDFYVLDKDLQLLAGSTQEVPVFIPGSSDVSWGITKRMKEHPSEVMLECNKTYKENMSRTKLLIGKAMVVKEKFEGYLIFVLYGDEFVKTSGIATTQIIVTDAYGNFFLTTTPGFTDTLDKLRSEFKASDNYMTIDGEKYYKRQSSCIEEKLHIYTFTPIGKLYRLFIGAGICFLVFTSILSGAMLVVAKKMTKQKTQIIDQLVEAFREVQSGNLDVTLHIASYDEFEVIGRSYNVMLHSIKQLIRSNEEKIRQTSLAQIKQLESQFNPHFLFNTLEHIRYMAKLEPSAASKMIVSLSTLLRYSINNSLFDVTLQEDIEYTKNYLLIQQYRYSERFHYTIYMEKGTQNCIVPKLILQPIIENAIKYGFGDKDELTIKIKASLLADDLVIVIYDDGVGMQRETLENLQEALSKESNPPRHIGLYNVHRRIQLMYGKAYGIEIKSQRAEGTVVKMTLPINIRGERNAESLSGRG